MSQNIFLKYVFLLINMPQFSTNEAVSLEKDIELNQKNTIETKEEDLEAVYEIKRCAEWIKANEYKKVCLQFPDHLLPDSSEVALRLEQLLDQPIYILGDTAYESCCIDYIAASHVNADAIIHFGPTCFSKTSANIPYLNIYEKHDFQVDNLEEIYIDKFGKNSEHVVMILDCEYLYKYETISRIFEKYKNVQLRKIDSLLNVDSVTAIIIVSSNNRKLLNLKLSHQSMEMYTIDPRKLSLEITKYEIDSKILKRRHYLIEKIKDSKTVGIVIGTLGVKNYLKVIDRVKKLATIRGKKYYLISVGKPTVAKLANFPEIDIYVMITCSLNEIYESREFYKPIVTPYDVELALNPSTSNNLKFSYDYNEYLSNLEDIDMSNIIEIEADVSLLSGNIRSNILQANDIDDHSTIISDQIAVKTDGTLALNSTHGAGFLAGRSWKGLEQNLGQTEVKIAEIGRKGIAQGYDNEPE